VLQVEAVPTTGIRRVHQTPLAAPSDDSLEGCGCLVDDPKSFAIEIVRWPAQGWRPMHENLADQGGVTEGIFEFRWKGETLYARNKCGRRQLSVRLEQLAGRSGNRGPLETATLRS
jgi:ureidoglycolate lyase